MSLNDVTNTRCERKQREVPAVPRPLKHSVSSIRQQATLTWEESPLKYEARLLKDLSRRNGACG